MTAKRAIGGLVAGLTLILVWAGICLLLAWLPLVPAPFPHVFPFRMVRTYSILMAIPNDDPRFSLLVVIPALWLAILVARPAKSEVKARAWLMVSLAVAVLVLAVASLGAGYGVAWTATAMRHNALSRVPERGQALLDALARYRAVNHHYPKALNDLKPVYLDAVPQTGIWGYPEFQYERLHYAEGFKLVVVAAAGFEGSDRLVYGFSEHEPQMYLRHEEFRVGEWTYYGQ